MTQEQLNQLGRTLWAIADDLRGACRYRPERRRRRCCRRWSGLLTR